MPYCPPSPPRNIKKRKYVDPGEHDTVTEEPTAKRGREGSTGPLSPSVADGPVKHDEPPTVDQDIDADSNAEVHGDSTAASPSSPAATLQDHEESEGTGHAGSSTDNVVYNDNAADADPSAAHQAVFEGAEKTEGEEDKAGEEGRTGKEDKTGEEGKTAEEDTATPKKGSDYDDKDPRRWMYGLYIPPDRFGRNKVAAPALDREKDLAQLARLLEDINVPPQDTFPSDEALAVMRGTALLTRLKTIPPPRPTSRVPPLDFRLLHLLLWREIPPLTRIKALAAAVDDEGYFTPYGLAIFPGSTLLPFMDSGMLNELAGRGDQLPTLNARWLKDNYGIALCDDLHYLVAQLRLWTPQLADHRKAAGKAYDSCTGTTVLVDHVREWLKYLSYHARHNGTIMLWSRGACHFKDFYVAKKLEVPEWVQEEGYGYPLDSGLLPLVDLWSLRGRLQPRHDMTKMRWLLSIPKDPAVGKVVIRRRRSHISMKASVGKAMMSRKPSYVPVRRQLVVECNSA